MSATRVAELSIRVLTSFVGAPNAQWIVARAYAIFYLVYFQLSVQYAKAVLGLLWVIITPALFLAVYLPVLTFIFNAKLPGAAGPLDYGFFIVVGFLVWGAFSDGFLQGASSVAHNGGVIKNTPTPPALLPFVKVTTAFAGLLIMIGLVIVILVVSGRNPGGRIVILPLAFGLLYMFTLGAALFFASLAVYIPDLLQLLPTLLLIEFFACPIVYSPDMANGKMARAVVLNPMSPYLGLFRASLAPTAVFAWNDLILAIGWAGLTFILGAIVFRRLEDGFADAL